ncbi:MAG: DUF1553 domain-containing protein [Planctomycetaceae bacterium]
MTFSVRIVIIAACTMATIATAADERSAPDDAAKREFFETRIRPVLIQHCYQCHSADAKTIRGGLLLDSRDGVIQGGESGAAVIPGNPDDSLLLSSLKHESFEMPPDRRLPDSVVADFEKWILDGAVDPRQGGTTIQRHTIDLEEGRRFWCFQPVLAPDVPDTQDSWCRTDIDRLIAERYRREKVMPGSDAAPEEVLRRLYFGLIGLPPTIDQISHFVQQWQLDPDKAIAETADELLASPHFGERWGRHWLDVTRFAESSGGGRSLMFPHAWRFRDYVIRSFNDDKPFDRLVREHIAGDLLAWETEARHDDQVTGVGYLTLGPTNYEQQDKELLRMEVVDEQVDTIGRTFLGLTLGCARCHDHKFDPVPTADYYAMAGIFRSTETLTPGNVSGYVTTSLKADSDAQRMEAWQTAEAALTTEIKALKKQLRVTRPTVEKHLQAASFPGIVIDDEQAVFEGEWTRSSFLAPFVAAGYHHDQAGKAGRRVRFEATLPASGMYHVRLCHNYADSRCNRVPVQVHHADGVTVAEINQQLVPADGVFSEVGVFRFEAGQAAMVSIDAEKSGPGVIIIDALQFLPVAKESSETTSTDDADARVKTAALSKRLTKLEAELKQHAKSKPTVPQAMGVRDMPEPADWHIHIRGGIRNLGDLVPRGFLSVATASDAAPEITVGESGRRELADWIASPDNPLTSRVFVNRVWLKLIGEGLVRTPDNFGKTGRLPTHPELLDHLAFTFVHDDRWSVKKLIRRIVVSRIYRLSSSPSPADPDNLLLTRGFRRRLEAEALRDAMLQVSGQLDLQTRGGLTIRRITAYDNGYDHDGAGDRFRSVYVPFFRNSLPDVFLEFDIANPNLVTGRRNVSNLPSQSLFLLNSPFVMEQSEHAARHFLQTASADPAAIDHMIDQAWLTAVGRAASDQERLPVVQLLNAHGHDSHSAWTAVFQALFGSMDFRYLE